MILLDYKLKRFEIMKYIEHRRHSHRNKPSQHLSQQGVELARRVGSAMGPFDLVITSKVQRAIETAVAMGFAVDDTNDNLSFFPETVEKEISFESSFPTFAAAYKKIDAVKTYASSLAQLLTNIIIDSELPENSTTLIISHGGIVEASCIGCLPDLDYSTWGGSVSYCEGVRLCFDNKKFVSAQLIRV